MRYVTPKHGRIPAMLPVALICLALASVLCSPAMADGPSRPAAEAKSAGGVMMDIKPLNPYDVRPSMATYVGGEIIVKLSDGDSVGIGPINRMFGLEVKRYFNRLGVFVLLTPSTEDINELARSISRMQGVVYAQPNYIVSPMQSVQGSFPFSDQEFTGSFSEQEAAQRLQIDDAHTYATGAGVTVGVIDGGVDFSHPALQGLTITGYDYVDEDDDPFDEPGGRNSGHGTFVAGVVHLVAPDAQILAYRVADTTGSSHGDVVAEAVLQAVDDGCQVINISLVMYAEHNLLASALEYARAQNVMVITAAGNGQHQGSAYPACDPNVLSVAAVDTLDLLADFSRCGPHVDLCAPGTGIYSAFDNPYYAWWSGTSFAAPFVAGEAALVIEHKGGSPSWGQLQAALCGTATQLDDINPSHAHRMGAGLINPVGSLTLMSPPDSAWLSDDDLSFRLNANANDTVFACLALFSTNPNAVFTASVADTPCFIQLIDTVGLPGDSICFKVIPQAFVPGGYSDTLMFDVTGVANSPLYCIITLTMVNQQQGDSAWVSPPSISYYESQGDSTRFCSVISSSNAPASYLVHTLSTTPTIWFEDSTGTTNDSVCFMVSTLGLPPGTYCDTLVYEVAGCSEPVIQTVCVTVTDTTTPPWSWLNPDTLHVTLDYGQTDPEIRYVFVGSYDDTASWVASAGYLTTPLTSWGLVNDLVGLSIDPTLMPDDDAFIDHVTFVVSQVDTLLLTVVVEFDLPAYVIPGTMNFAVPFGLPNTITGSGWLQVPGDTISYTGAAVGGTWLTLIDSIGTGSDSVHALIDPDGLAIGYYSDTIEFNVQGVSYPVSWIFNLTVVDDTIVGPNDSAFASPNFVEYTVAPYTPLSTFTSVYLTSTNAPAQWFGYVLHGGQFTTLVDSAGYTNNAAHFNVQHAGLAPGYYCDTILYQISGFVQAIPVYVRMFVEDPGQPETSAVTPDSFYVEVQEGMADTVLASAYLTSSNAPADYLGTLLDHTNKFVKLLDWIGTTNDTLRFRIQYEGFDPGTYTNTVRYWVANVDSSLFIKFVLVVQPAAAKLGQNYPNPFNPDTKIAFSLATAQSVRLEVFNVLGQRVVTLADEFLPAGDHEVIWNGTDGNGEAVASGVYFYRLSTEKSNQVRKMMLMK